MNGNKRPVWEWVVFVAIIVLVAVTVSAGYRNQQNIEKQKSLHYQLQVLRTAELLYKAVNKNNPQSLKQLVDGKFNLAGEGPTRPYIDPPPKLSGDKLIDPFGNPYVYDPATGKVKSTTPGYDYW